MGFAKKVGSAEPQIWQSPLLKLYQSYSKSWQLIINMATPESHPGKAHVS
jgi:hypothetical protein